MWGPEQTETLVSESMPVDVLGWDLPWSPSEFRPWIEDVSRRLTEIENQGRNRHGSQGKSSNGSEAEKMGFGV